MFKKRAPFFILLLFLLVSSASALEYYVAGGYVGGESDHVIDILNPGGSAADVVVELFFEKNSSERFSARVNPHSTLAIGLSERVNGGFGAVLTSDSAIVVDSVQYDSAYSAGFASPAVMKPGFAWYFGEGYSSGMAKTYLYLLNPGARSSDVGVTLYYDNGEKKTFNLNVPAYRSLRVDLKEKTMPEKRFGMMVTGTAPIVAASGSMNKHFSAGSGGAGSQVLSRKWYFADGYASDDASEFLNIVNPSLYIAHVTATMYYSDGSLKSFDETVPANSKRMFLLNNYVDKLEWYSTVVESDVEVAAEMTHYDDTYSAGHGGVGVVAPLSSAYFAHAVAGGDDSAHIAVFNPSLVDAVLNLTFYYSDGSVKSVSSRAPAMARSTVDLDQVAVAGKDFGLGVFSTVPVVSWLVVYDSAHSAGYGYSGVALPAVAADEDEDAVDEDAGNELTGSAVMPSYVLVDEEDVSPSRFRESVSAGLEGVVKSTYDYDGSTLLVWHFSYADEASASSALQGALSGSLFDLLEVSPSVISGAAVHRFVSNKSEGYVWLNSTDLYLFVAGRGSEDVASGLAGSFVSPVGDGAGSSLWSILLVLVALVLLVVVVRWFFRPGRRKDDDSWEDMIPSAKPKEKSKGRAVKSADEDAKGKAKKAKKSPVKKPAKAPPKKEEKEAGQEKGKEKEPVPEEKKDEKEPASKAPEEKKEKEPAREKKEEKKDTGKGSFSIKEIPREKLTAQDILDHLDEVPDYEDVFRHVNRDQEVIKPKPK